MGNSIINSYNFDVCFIAFNEPMVDARSINITKLVAKKGKKTALIAYGTEDDRRYYKSFGIDFFPIEKSKHTKVSVRWSIFKIDAGKLKEKIDAKFYYACDLYSLPVASDMKKAMRFMGAKSKLYYDSREIYSELGPLSGQSFKQAVISKIEKMLVPMVDKMITSGEMDSEYLKKYFKHETPYMEILNLPPYQAIPKSDLLRNKAKLEEDVLILVYQGMILKGRGLQQAIDAVNKMDKVHLFIIGSGEYYQELANYTIQVKANKKVTFTGRVPYSRLLEITASADAGLCLFEPISLSYEYALPNKLFEYIMAGIPSIATDLPQMRKVIQKEKVGLLVNKDLNEVELIEKINEMRDVENRKLFIEQAHLVSKDYSYESQTDKIMSLFP